ncbi:MAG: hypothetical protein PUG60_10485 [Lachnospiraceae bacterium]|nr:hypothetical protein [Lachnospiraceae bacterium]
MEYNGVHVDERYSSIIEPNFYFDSIFQPGLTFSDQFQGDAANAGAVQIYKLADEEEQDPKMPASDFSDENAENALIPLLLNNMQQKSKKIYNIQETAVPYAMAEAHLSQSTRICRSGWQRSGLACLATELNQSNDTEAITAANIESKIIASRKDVRLGKAAANVVLASVATYSAMLEAAGSRFTPMKNDEIIETGQVGYWLGMLWVECNQMDLTKAAKYYDYTGTLKTADLSLVDYMMYDWRGMHIVDNLSMARLKDSERFNGTLAQVEICSGYRVGNAAYGIVKKHAV